MNHPDFSDAQGQLVKCQEVLDAARQEGWTPALLAAFLDATRALHEAAAVRKAIHNHRPGTERERRPPRLNLLHPPKKKSILSPQSIGC